MEADDEAHRTYGHLVNNSLESSEAATFPAGIIGAASDFGNEADFGGLGTEREDGEDDEEDMGDDFDEQLQQLAKKGKKRKSKLDPNLSHLMGEANMAYALQEYSRAVELLLDIIRQAPNVSDPYHTLGLIYEDMGDKKKALEFFMIAAHISPKDASLWRRLGLMSRDVGNMEQAIYCYSKVIRLDPSDCDAIWDRSVIYAEKGKYAKAIRGFVALHELTGGDTDVSKELARLYHQTGQTDRAIAVLSTSLEQWKEKQVASTDPSDLDLDMVNMLAELYMSTENYQQAINLIDDTHKRLSTQILPLDLTINFGICQAHLGNMPLAERQFEKLMEKNVNTYGDLFFDVAETFTKVGEPAKAALVFERLVQNPQYNMPHIWQLQAQCYKDSGNITSAINTYLEVVRVEPNNAEARLALSELYKMAGNYDAAIAIVSHNSVSLAQQGNQHHLDTTEEKSEHVIADSTATSASLDDQDYEWLDGQHVKMVVQKALLYYSLEQHQAFLDTVLPLIYASCRSGRNTSKAFSRRPRKRRGERGERRPRRRRSKRTRRASAKATAGLTQPLDTSASDQRDNLLQFGLGRRTKSKTHEEQSATSLAEGTETATTTTTTTSSTAETASSQPQSTVNEQRVALMSIVDNQCVSDSHTPAATNANANDNAPEKLVDSQLQTNQNTQQQNEKNDKGKEKEREAYSSEEEAEHADEDNHDVEGNVDDDDDDRDYVDTHDDVEDEDYIDDKEDANEDFYADEEEMSDQALLESDTLIQRDTSVFESIVSAITLDGYFELVLKVCKALVSFERHGDAAAIVKDLLSCKFIERDKRDQLHFLYVGVAFDHGDFEAAYDGIRLICLRNPSSTRAWNLLNTTTIRMGRFNSKSNHKFVVRQLLRSPNSVPLMILAGHDCNISGSHKFALGEYFRAYQLQSKHPMISLCIGLTYLAQVMNRRLPERHYMVCQAFTFLYQYHHLREGDSPQEAAFNLARAFHQLGLAHLAVPYYEKALSMQAPDDYPTRAIYDLKREAAYNLSQIYKASGAPHLALQITRQFCTI